MFTLYNSTSLISYTNFTGSPCGHIYNFPWHCSAMMDCVGCEKCRLWGKLQVLGLGTAMKILFSVDGPEQLGQTVRISHS